MSEVRPLSNTRVLAVEHFLAAPWCTQILADAGAEVIKIERPTVGDPRRAYEPYLESDNVRVSGGFAPFNRNKKSVELDFTCEAGKAVFLELAASADVLVENMRPHLLEDLGIGHSVISKHNPRLVYCGISGFGWIQGGEGPYSSWPAFDPVIQAMSGLASLVGTRDGPPLLLPAGITDLLSGASAATAICMALLQRNLTTKGQLVEVSMYEVVAQLLARPLAIYDWTGSVMSRGSDEFTPVGVVRCEDGYVALIIPTEEMWRRCCEAVGRQDLLEDERLTFNRDRSRAMETVIIPALEEWSADKRRQQVCDELISFRIPAGMVQTVDEVAHCKHLSAREFFVTVDDDVAGERHYPRLPALFSDFKADHRRSPRLGEHTREVLEGIGIGMEEIASLRLAGVIG